MEILEKTISDSEMCWNKTLENSPEKFSVVLNSKSLDELHSNRSKILDEEPNDFQILSGYIQNLKDKILINGCGFFVINGKELSNFGSDEKRSIHVIISKIIGKLLRLMKKYNVDVLENVKTSSHPMSVILPLSDYFLSSSTSTSLEAMSLGITQANLDVGGLPKANPLHLFPHLIKDLETPEDILKFFKYPENFQISREKAKLFFGDAILDPKEQFTKAVIAKFHENNEQ